MRNVRSTLPRAKAEVRIDSAFFNEAIAERLRSLGVEFTISVLFERLTDLRGLVEGRRRWCRMVVGLGDFEIRWKPKSWNARYRFIFIRKQVRYQNESPIQLDLFQPTKYGYEFKVIMTNKRINPRKVVAFHEGRGSQEGIFSEFRTHCQTDYVPVKTRVGNQLTYSPAFLLTTSLASYRSNLTLAPVARQQNVPRCGACGRFRPCVVPSSNAPVASFAQPAS